MFFTALLTTMSFESAKKPVMVNLQSDPAKKIVKAKLLDKTAIDQEIQRQAAEELQTQQLAQEQALETQRAAEKKVAEQRKLELEKAAELEKAQLAAKLAQEKKQVAQQQAAAKQEAQKKEALKKESLKKEAAKQELLKQQAAAKKAADLQAQQAKQAEALRAQQAAALKAKSDRIAAEHQQFLVAEVDKYRAAFQAAVEDNRILSAVFTGDISCKIRIRLLPDGSIASVNIVETSGNPAYDEMSAQAVHKSAPFPMPADRELYDQLRDIVLSFKNGEQSADAI